VISRTHVRPFIACDQPTAVMARVATCSSSSGLIPPSSLCVHANASRPPSWRNGECEVNQASRARIERTCAACFLTQMLKGLHSAGCARAMCSAASRPSFTLAASEGACG